MKKLLQKAELKIREEMDRRGFIDDSDYTNRFLDNLALELAKEKILKNNDDIDFYYEKEYEIEELQVKLLKEIKEKIMNKYRLFCTCNEYGYYKACYYEVDKDFETWDEFNNHFGLGE